MIDSIQHSFRVEYYLHLLGLSYIDPQWPHDINGKGSKFSWPVIKGLVFRYESKRNKELFEKYVLPSQKFHRKHQHHHQKWENPTSGASEEEMKIGAVDTLSSLLDNRYHGKGVYSFDEMEAIIKRNEPYKHRWLWLIHSEMRDLPKPKVETITSLDNIPNIGIPEEIYQKTIELKNEAIKMLREQHGYNL